MTHQLFARTIRVILVLVVAYALWTVVVPWMRSHGSFDQVALPKALDRNPPQPDTGEQGSSVEACLSAARSANDRVTYRLRDLRDPAAAAKRWESMSQPLHDEVQTASDACSCAAPACQRASDAMAALDDLIGQFDSSFDGRAESLPDVGMGEREVQRLLQEARKLAAGNGN